MKKNTRIYSLYSSSVLNILTLFGTVFVCMSSLLAQSNPWTTKRVMPTARYDLSASVVNGKIYVIGGQTTGIGVGAPASPKVEEYDPITDTWDTTKTPMPTGRNSFSSSAVNGKIYVFGGQTEAVITNISSVEEYDPQTDTWDSTKAPMPDKRVGSSASTINGKIYVIGGWDYSGPNDIYYGNVWEYDPISDTWDDTTKMDMPTPRAYLRTSVIDGKIYAFGGRDANAAFERVEAYDPDGNTWSTKSDMPAGRSYLMASSVDSLIYIFGGSTGPFDPPMSNAWEYNPAADSFRVVSPMPTALITSTCNEVSGKIYIIGGSMTPWVFQPDSLVLEYNPYNDPLSLLTAIDKKVKIFPNAFSLNQNYPNPFNPETTIQYHLAKRSDVKLTIVNLLGQRVAMLVDEVQSTGIYSVKWDGKDDAGVESASGVYLYRLQTRESVQAKKLVLLR